MAQEGLIDEGRLREVLLDYVASADSGGCGQYIVLSNAIMNADADQLKAFAREYGISLTRFRMSE